jgi:hypothetical protein
LVNARQKEQTIKRPITNQTPPYKGHNRGLDPNLAPRL